MITSPPPTGAELLALADEVHLFLQRETEPILVELFTRIENALRRSLPESGQEALREQIARIIEENIYHKHDGNWDGDRKDLLAAADTILSLLRLPEATGVREALEEIPFALWADKIERTTRISIVRHADSYGAEMRAAHIECFYDFEAKRLIALLRSLAALFAEQSGGPTPVKDMSE